VYLPAMLVSLEVLVAERGDLVAMLALLASSVTSCVSGAIHRAVKTS